jgi:hypothetical protein
LNRNIDLIMHRPKKYPLDRPAHRKPLKPGQVTRMAQGRRPDAASLAALSAWAGLNPSDFVQAPYKSHSPDAIAQISTLLRNDPSLDADSAETLEAIVKTAYERFKKAEK